MNEYKIVRLDDKTVSYLDILFKCVYKRVQKPSYFKTKYNTKHILNDYIGFFALHQGKPIAFYGLIPTLMSINKEIVLAAQSADTMTHPDYQKQGLFIKLAELTFNLAKEKGVHFIFGFPNQNSFKSFVIKLGFVNTDTMNRYTIISKDSLSKRLKRKFLFLKNYSCQFKNALIEEGYDGVIYNDQFIISKRQLQSQFENFQDTTIWLKPGKQLMVGAIEGEVNMTELLAFLNSKFSPESITFMISEKTKLDTALSIKQTVQKGFPVIVKNLTNQYRLENLKFQFADIDIF